MVVIILAMIAIVTAVVIMVWPTNNRGGDVDRKGTLEPPPAPERMDTKPTPPPGQQKAPAADDPWGPSGQIAPPPQVDPLDPTSPGGNSDGMAKVRARPLGDGMGQCANVGSLQSLCNAALQNATAPSCPAARRCLEHVDTISCSTSTDDDATAVMVSLMTKVPDCVDALKC